MKNSKPIALIAGFGFIFLAIAVQGIIPAVMKESRVKDVTRTVRTPLGQLKEVKAEINGGTAKITRPAARRRSKVK